MALDIGHQWGADLDIGATGGLAVVSGSIALTQRVLRRLLTNPGDYIWKLNYGAGLAGFIGKADARGKIATIIHSQMRLEAAVASSPPPQVIMMASTEPHDGSLDITIQYTDALSGQVSSVPVRVVR